MPLWATGLQSFNNQASIEALIFQFDYDETIHGKFVDGVKGSIPGARLTTRKQIKHFILEPSLSFKQGELEYTGGTTNSTSSHELTKDTDNYFFNADAILGYIYTCNQKQALMPYLHYGYRRWLREVPPIGYIVFFGTPTNIGVNSYTETYQNQYGLLGLEFQQVLDDKVVVSVAAGAGYTFKASLFTNLPTPLPMKTIGVKEGLGSKPMYELKIKLDYEIKPHYHILATASYTDFAYGKSKVKIYTYEPNSSTNELTGSLGLAVDLV